MALHFQQQLIDEIAALPHLEQRLEEEHTRMTLGHIDSSLLQALANILKEQPAGDGDEQENITPQETRELKRISKHTEKHTEDKENAKPKNVLQPVSILNKPRTRRGAIHTLPSLAKILEEPAALIKPARNAPPDEPSRKKQTSEYLDEEGESLTKEEEREFKRLSKFLRF